MDGEASGSGGFGGGFGGAYSSSGNGVSVDSDVFSENSDDSESGMLMDDTVAGVILEWIQCYYTPALVGFGTIGNCLSVVVFFFSTKLRKLSSSYYLSALAISDTGYLFCTFFSWLNVFDIDLFNRPGFCEFTVYLTQVCSFLSVWFIVAFTVERFIAVRYPLKRPSLCTVSKAKIVLAWLSLVASVCYAPYLFIVEVVRTNMNGTNVSMCGPQEDQMHTVTILNHIDTVINLVVPFLTIIILNTMISRTVCLVARDRRHMTKGAHHCHGHHSHHGHRSSTSSQAKVTEMLLLVSTVFVTLNLPYYVLRLWLYLSGGYKPMEEQDQSIIAIQQFFYILLQTNFGINFALYCVSGQNFRRALLSLLRPQYYSRKRGVEASQVTVVSEFSRTASARRTFTVNGSWREAHELVPMNRGIEYHDRRE